MRSDTKHCEPIEANLRSWEERATAIQSSTKCSTAFAQLKILSTL